MSWVKLGLADRRLERRQTDRQESLSLEGAICVPGKRAALAACRPPSGKSHFSIDLVTRINYKSVWVGSVGGPPQAALPLEVRRHLTHSPTCHAATTSRPPTAASHHPGLGVEIADQDDLADQPSDRRRLFVRSKDTNWDILQKISNDSQSGLKDGCKPVIRSAATNSTPRQTKKTNKKKTNNLYGAASCASPSHV
jgi:hypothetical protein